jgi:hypothetical protein
MSQKTTCKLCYVEGSCGLYRAWFTPLPLDEQWGDDWDDVPYEHNAGIPYQHRYKIDVRIPIKLKTIVFENRGENNEWFAMPSDKGQFSVKQINDEKKVPWLMGVGKSLYAGASPKDLERFVEGAGGTVFVPKTSTRAL